MILSGESQKKTRLQALLLLGLVFVLGGITGAALDGLYRLRAVSNNTPGNRPPMLDRMRGDLNLSNEQVEKIRVIMEDSRKDFHQQMKECSGMKESQQRSRSSIRAVLNAEQQQKFDELNMRRDAERKAKNP
jgi:Spy/CpxP family protein refolding chaperone